MSKGFRVTVEDLDTGDTQSRVIAPGDYIVIPFAPCYLAGSVHHATGGVQLTIKDHHPQKLGE